MYEFIKETDFTRELSTKSPKGGYLFFGGEDYTKSHAAEKLKETVTSGDPFADMNTSIIDGADYDAGSFEGAILNIPVFAERKFVMLRDLPLSALTRGKEQTKLDIFCDILSRLPESPQTVLLIYYSSSAVDFGDVARKRPSAYYKRLCEFLQPVYFEQPKENSLRSWITRHFNSEGLQITTAAVTELLRLCGRSMFTLSGEIEKLCAYVKSESRDAVDESDVDKIVSATIEDEDFALSNAVLSGDRAVIFEAVRKLKLQRQEPIAISATVSRVCRNMFTLKKAAEEGLNVQAAAKALGLSEYPARLAYEASAKYSQQKLADMLECCLETDRLLKSTRLGYAAVDRMLCELFGA